MNDTRDSDDAQPNIPFSLVAKLAGIVPKCTVTATSSTSAGETSNARDVRIRRFRQ